MCKKSSQAISEIIPGATIRQEGAEMFITIKGKSRSFTPQLIAQLPNQSVIDYINDCFDLPAGMAEFIHRDFWKKVSDEFLRTAGKTLDGGVLNS